MYIYTQYICMYVHNVYVYIYIYIYMHAIYCVLYIIQIRAYSYITSNVNAMIAVMAG